MNPGGNENPSWFGPLVSNLNRTAKKGPNGLLAVNPSLGDSLGWEVLASISPSLRYSTGVREKHDTWLPQIKKLKSSMRSSLHTRPTTPPSSVISSGLETF